MDRVATAKREVRRRRLGRLVLTSCESDDIRNANVVLVREVGQLERNPLQPGVFLSFVLLGQDERAIATAVLAFRLVPGCAVVERCADGRTSIIVALSVAQEHARQFGADGRPNSGA